LIAIGAAAWWIYQYIASAPQRAEKVLQDGARLMAKGDFKGAETAFTRAVDIWPPLASGFLARGLARRSLNQPDAAVEDFEHALSLDSNMAPAHTALGEIYRERGDVQRAVKEFTVSIGLAVNTDSLYQRGQLYESLGQHDKAIADYDAAINAQPDAPYVYRARAMSRDAIGDHDDAEADREVANHIEKH
jgi:tetratricopeptide (TPR) repeat protein